MPSSHNQTELPEAVDKRGPMTRLGLTQRVQVIEEYGERRDCLSQEWTTLLGSTRFQPVPLPNTVNNARKYIKSINLDGIILTGGNDIASLDNPTNPAPERDQFERDVIEYAIKNQVPLLGVCRGLEFLIVMFGGTLSEVNGHIAEDHQVLFEPYNIPIDGLSLPERATVNSYHEYGIEADDVPESFKILGQADDGTIECVAHESHPFVGIMWHPERESQCKNTNQQIFHAVFQS